MATIKSHTDLSQSKTLSKILPLESADFVWLIGHLHTDGLRYEVIRTKDEVSEPENYWPCWSLSALLSVLPYPDIKQRYDGKWVCRVENKDTTYLWVDSNQIDACVAMIEKLHEQNIL